LYLHVFDWPESGELLVPGLKSPVQESYLLADKKPLEFRSSDDGVLVSLPSQSPDENDSVIALKVRGPLEIESTSSAAGQDGSLVLTAEMAFLHNNEGSPDVRVRGAEGNSNIGYWTDAHAWVEWPLKIEQPGEYYVSAEIAVQAASSNFRFGLPNQPVLVEVKSTGGYGSYETRPLGTISFDEAGEYSLQIRPDVERWQPINVRKVQLKLK